MLWSKLQFVESDRIADRVSRVAARAGKNAHLATGCMSVARATPASILMRSALAT